VHARGHVNRVSYANHISRHGSQGIQKERTMILSIISTALSVLAVFLSYIALIHAEAAHVEHAHTLSAADGLFTDHEERIGDMEMDLTFLCTVSGGNANRGSVSGGGFER
jgi:hypothetical protein